jgi:hypothetical protein
MSLGLGGPSKVTFLLDGLSSRLMMSCLVFDLDFGFKSEGGPFLVLLLARSTSMKFKSAKQLTHIL